MQKTDFIEIHCDYRKSNGIKCWQFLGYFQSNTPNTAIFYCKNCKVLTVVISDESGIVTKKMTSSKKRLGTVNSLAIVA